MIDDSRPAFWFDLETVPFSRGNMAPAPVSIAGKVEGEAGTSLQLADQIPAVLGPWLERAAAGEATVGGFSVDYDLAVILAHVPELAPLVWRAVMRGGIRDLRARERLLAVAVGDLGGKPKGFYGLEQTASRYVGGLVFDKDPALRTSFGALLGVPVAEWSQRHRAYAAGDVEPLPLLWRAQDERARQLNYDLPTEALDAASDLAFRLTSVWGICTDGEAVAALDLRVRKRMAELGEILKEAKLVRGGKQGTLFAGAVEEIGSKDLAEIRRQVMKHYPGGIPPVTPAGEIQTTAEVLSDCNWPPFDALVEYSSLEKTGSTYVEAMKVSPIHSRFESLGAVSYRASSAEPNIENQPRLPGVRECYVPRPGFAFLACDYEAQEMRTLAQSCIDLGARSVLAERFRDPTFDPHLELAALQFLKTDLEAARRALAANDPEITEARQRAKPFNFGRPGGMGIQGLMRYAKKAYGVILTEAQATEACAGFDRQWPEVATMFRYVRNLVGDAGYARWTMPRTGYVRGRTGYTDGCNGFFQTPAAFATKSAHVEACRRMYDVPTSALYGSRPVNFVHDELILETPIEVIHEAAEELEAVLVEAQERVTPDVPARAKATAMTRWSKKAKRVMDAHGRLVPYEVKL